MKRAFSTLCCLDYSVEQIVDLAQKNDLAVELRADDRNLYGDPDELLKKYNMTLDEFGG